MIQKTIWDSIEETQTIFIEKDVFTVDYEPETFKFRKSQINKIIYNLKSNLSHDKRPYHMLLKGAYATGKTLTIKYVFKEAEKEFENIRAVHINCKTSKSVYQIYLKIYEKLFDKEMTVGGLSTSTILTKIMKKTAKDNIILLVCLDDINSVKSDRDLNDVLYNLLRASETDRRVKIALFTVTNEKTILFLDKNVQTVFNTIDVNFTNYNVDEIHSILEERCRLGLHNHAISDDLILQVAKYSYNFGDLRKGLHEIYNAGLNAEYEGSDKIMKSHFK